MDILQGVTNVSRVLHDFLTLGCIPTPTKAMNGEYSYR